MGYAFSAAGLNAILDQNAIFDEERNLSSQFQAHLRSGQIKLDDRDIIERCSSYVFWVNNDLSVFDSINHKDKFALLIDVARKFDKCCIFLSEEVAVNPSTIWRWATGKTRPSHFLGENLVFRIRLLLIDCVSDDLDRVNMSVYRCTK